MTIIELFDPFGWVGESIAAGNGEMRELAVLSIPVGWLAEGVNVSNKAGLKELNGFTKVIQLLLMGLFLGSKGLVVLV